MAFSISISHSCQLTPSVLSVTQVVMPETPLSRSEQQFIGWPTFKCMEDGIGDHGASDRAAAVQ